MGNAHNKVRDDPAWTSCSYYQIETQFKVVASQQGNSCLDHHIYIGIALSSSNILCASQWLTFNGWKHFYSLSSRQSSVWLLLPQDSTVFCLESINDLSNSLILLLSSFNHRSVGSCLSRIVQCILSRCFLSNLSLAMIFNQMWSTLVLILLYIMAKVIEYCSSSFSWLFWASRPLLHIK